MQYPESKMQLAVHMGSGLVKIYGNENDGFRPFVRSIQCDSKPKAIYFCSNHNDDQRKALGIKN